MLGCVPGIRERRKNFLSPQVACGLSGETKTSSVGGTSAEFSGNGGGTAAKGIREGLLEEVTPLS